MTKKRVSRRLFSTSLLGEMVPLCVALRPVFSTETPCFPPDPVFSTIPRVFHTLGPRNPGPRTPYFFERKVWRVQVTHLHNAARALSSQSRCFQLSKKILTKISFVYFDIVVKKQTNRMWFSVVCTLIDSDTGHHSGQNFVVKPFC